MGRKKQTINPAQAKHLNEFKTRLKLTQREMEKAGEIPDQRLSKILNGHGSLQQYQAQALAKAFPPYRWQWLYGLDEIPTTDDLILLQRGQYAEMAGEEAGILHSVLMVLASMSGYFFTYGNIGKNEDEAAIEGENSWYSLMHIGSAASVNLSKDDIQKLELKLVEYAGLLFCNALYGKEVNDVEG